MGRERRPFQDLGALPPFSSPRGSVGTRRKMMVVSRDGDVPPTMDAWWSGLVWAPLARARPRFGVGAGPRARPRPGDRPSTSVGRRGGLPLRSHIPALRVRREDEPAARVRDILGQPFSDAGAVTRHSSRVMKSGAPGGTRGSGEPGGRAAKRRLPDLRAWGREGRRWLFRGTGTSRPQWTHGGVGSCGLRLPRGGLGSA